MAGLKVGSFLYADDLILLAPSVLELQSMVDICCSELNAIDLKLNISKSTCISIGRRWHVDCKNIIANNDIIPWASDIIYLGVRVMANKKFTHCSDRSKSKFNSSFNAVYGKLGKLKTQL